MSSSRMLVRKIKRPLACAVAKPLTGMAISKPILEQTLEEYKKLMSVNGQ